MIVDDQRRYVAGAWEGLWGFDDEFFSSSLVGEERVVTVKAGAVRSIERRVLYTDSDVDVASNSVAISYGTLPAGALVLAALARVDEQFSGGVGLYSADMGITGNDDLFTPTILDIDGILGVIDPQVTFIYAGGEEVFLTLNGTINLDNLTAGDGTFILLYVVPHQTILAAP